MKKTITQSRGFCIMMTLAAMLLASFPARAQYMSFFGDSTWEYHITYITQLPEDYVNYPPELPNQLGVFCQTYTWRFNKNFYSDYFQSYFNLPPDTIIYVGGVRLHEDTVHGRLYYFNIPVCDMSLSEGDTFVIPYYDSDKRYMLVDSVRYILGRKTIYLSLINHLEDYFFGTPYANQQPNQHFSIRFIEGIGATYGFGEGRMPHQDVFPLTRFLSLLLCMYKDGELVYMVDENLGCYQTCVGVKEHPRMVMNLYPNPATQYVVLDMSTGEEMNGSVVITDMLGRQCRQQKAAGTSCQISVSDLPTGMYFLTYTDGKMKVTRKFLKE